MSFHRIVRCLPFLLFPLLTAHHASAAVVFATDFNSTAIGTYANNTVLNSGGVTTDNVTLRSAAGSATAIVDRGSGDHALQFTDNSSDAGLTANPRAYSNTFGPMSTTSTGDNRLVGSFNYTRLLATTSNADSPTFAFAASSDGQVLLSSAQNTIRFAVESNGRLWYANGATNNDSGFTLVTGTEYRFQIDADFSSSTQDTWGLRVTPVGSSTAVVNLTGLGTRAPNVQVNIISMLGGANQGAVNASPFAQIDNISFATQPVPEPTSMACLLIASGLLSCKRPTKK